MHADLRAALERVEKLDWAKLPDNAIAADLRAVSAALRRHLDAEAKPEDDLAFALDSLARVVSLAHCSGRAGVVPRWSHVGLATSHGSGSSAKLCKLFGLNPHEVLSKNSDVTWAKPPPLCTADPLRAGVTEAERAAQVERDDLVYTDELAIQAARDVHLREVMHGVPPTQAAALLRAFLARVTVLARRASKTDRAALEQP